MTATVMSLTDILLKLELSDSQESEWSQDPLRRFLDAMNGALKVPLDLANVFPALLDHYPIYSVSLLHFYQRLSRRLQMIRCLDQVGEYIREHAVADLDRVQQFCLTLRRLERVHRSENRLAYLGLERSFRSLIGTLDAVSVIS